MIEVVWLRSALKNLEDLHAYYSEKGYRKEAVKLIHLIEKTVGQLEQLPSLGRVGRVSETREILVPYSPFVIVYRERRTQIQILRVLHSSQKWPGSH